MQDNSFWLDRPTFVTGATGHLGSWLVGRLLDLRAEVVCLVRDWVPQSELVRRGLLEQVKVVRGDLREPGLLERTLGEYEIDTVIHLAAQSIVGVANRDPVTTFDTNIRATWLLLEACRQASTVKQVVLASTDKVYGEVEELPYTEEMPYLARYPHDVSKACAEMIAQCYAATYDLRLGMLRLPNLFGGGDLNWNRIIPGTIRAILRGQAPVIHSDGQFVRDYLYVEDAAAAHLLLAERLSGNAGLSGQAFNLSNESHLTVLQLVRRILELMESELQPLVQDQAKNEIRSQYLSAARARNVLGWQSIFTLDEGLQRTIDWYRAFFAAEAETLE
jgi:CDP-glucose 4,6-dehydratase